MERHHVAPSTVVQESFNPPGGFGAFGTEYKGGDFLVSKLFQSAGRIWGFWNGGDCRR